MMTLLLLLNLLLLVLLFLLLHLLPLLHLLKGERLRLQVTVKLETVHQEKVEQYNHLLQAVQPKRVQLILRMQTLGATVHLKGVNQQVTPLMKNQPPPPPQQQQQHQHILLNSQTTRRVMQTAAAVSAVLCGCVHHY
ncbi:uncharacterized protein TM35_000551140 [Trypanosoma theileri]|uniref:Uncharacterized protein n=1 Tax=Trypanosoma theileri TaxID=67003 RepID=A0A1X0NGK4_9TRYP|nr:uncharacterized protein TM35_000551140 [Trypanosoma theileri]ORC83845.1 hypothetical protein TM35_000551140 [Trypanosoma theileri]